MSLPFRRRSPHRHDRWRIGLLLGLGTSSFSTAVVALGARLIGRDAKVDWMGLGTILLRGRAARCPPGLAGMAAGIAVHQSADIFWAALWTRLVGGKGSWRRQRLTIIAWLPWALATAAVEYWLILTWLQRLVRMDVPYWTAATVHVTSGAAYPLMPLAERAVTGRRSDDERLGRAVAAALAVSLLPLAALRALGALDREPPWPWRSASGRARDRWFLRTMTEHHRAGLTLSVLAAEHAAARDLRTLGRLMAAEHQAQLALMASWWRSWEQGEIPPPTDEDQQTMVGMPSSADLEELSRLRGRAFDERFLDLMVPHHRGGVAMSRRLERTGGDPRLRLFAEAIVHAQLGQIERMEQSRP
jgi:uncharacterized protein (DUF305 family)